MTIRKKKGFIHGLATAFIARNNDINGYWAPGVLCRRSIELGQNTVSFKSCDLYNNPHFRLCGLHFAYMTALIQKSVDKFTLYGDGLTVIVRFSMPQAGETFLNGLLKVMGEITVQLHQGEKSVKTVYAFECWPHDQAYESQSTRAAV